MSPQETQLLENFLNQLVQARADTKDPQADALITAAVARQPDSAYLLIQRALLQDQALASAKAQIASLQNELQAARANASSNFLDAANAWGNSPNAPVSRPVSAAPAGTVQQQPAASSPPRFLGGFGNTLGNIASTAAGVAGGALLFQGIENLFHHGTGSGFLSQPALGSLPGDATVINNYFDGDGTSADMRNTGPDSSFLDTDLSGTDFADDDSSII